MAERGIRAMARMRPEYTERERVVAPLRRAGERRLAFGDSGNDLNEWRAW